MEDNFLRMFQKKDYFLKQFHEDFGENRKKTEGNSEELKKILELLFEQKQNFNQSSFF